MYLRLDLGSYSKMNVVPQNRLKMCCRFTRFLLIALVSGHHVLYILTLFKSNSETKCLFALTSFHLHFRQPLNTDWHAKTIILDYTIVVGNGFNCVHLTTRSRCFPSFLFSSCSLALSLPQFRLPHSISQIGQPFSLPSLDAQNSWAVNIKNRVLIFN